MSQKDNHTTITDPRAIVARFVKDREWGRFHTPRNLAEPFSKIKANPEARTKNRRENFRRKSSVKMMGDGHFLSPC